MRAARQTVTANQHVIVGLEKQHFGFDLGLHTDKCLLEPRQEMPRPGITDHRKFLEPLRFATLKRLRPQLRRQVIDRKIPEFFERL